MNRKENLRRLALLSLAGAALGCGQAGAQVSLTTVVDLAQRNSNSVKIAEADIRKSEAVLSESRDVVIPSLLFSTGLPVFPEVGFTGTIPSIWSATAQSLVFSVPQKRYIDAARAGLKAAAASLKDAREQAALDASTAYVELDTVTQELETAHQQEGSAQHLVEIEQQRAEAGVDPLSALLEARLMAANVRLKRIHLESRAATLKKQIAQLTGLPVQSIQTQHASIPEIPQVSGDPRTLPGVSSAQFVARSRQLAASGDQIANYFPQLAFGMQYFRSTNLLNSVNQFFARPLPANNFSSGISINVPLLDFEHRAKARESAADALRAKVEAEQAQRQNELQIAQLSASMQELDTLAEIANLKQQIASENLKTVQTQLQYGNGTGAGPGSTPQLSPKAEQEARIDVAAKQQDALDAGFDLSKARLQLLRALGHMEDWLKELNVKPLQ